MSTATLNCPRVTSAARSNRAPRRNLARHARKCSICNHLNREAIEHDFLNCRSPFAIVNDYQLSHHTAIYRHAHATGLDIERRRHMRVALESIIEQAGRVQPTADAIVRAVCVYSQFDGSGRWIKPQNTKSRLHVSLCPECGAKSKHRKRAAGPSARKAISNSESRD
jgi:hypothetical protein